LERWEIRKKKKKKQKKPVFQTKKKKKKKKKKKNGQIKNFKTPIQLQPGTPQPNRITNYGATVFPT
jgi:hypothetical protein